MNKFLKIVLIVCPLLFLVIGQYHPIDDMSRDLSEHILIGKAIYETHQIISTNLFSYTNTNYPYFDYGWLTEVIFYLVFSHFGLYALFILKVLLVLASFLIIYLFCFKRYNTLLLSFLSLIYFLIFLDRTSLRPEVVSYVFIAITITTLFRSRERFNKFIYLLIPLQALWVNMHLYFVVGLVLQFLFLIEASILFRKKDHQGYFKALLIIFFSSIVATCISPYGLNALLYPISLFQNYALPVRENLNVFAAQQLQPNTFIVSLWVYFLLAIGIVFFPFIKQAKNRLIDIFITVLFVIVGGLATRNLQVFVLASFISFIHMFSLIFEDLIGYLRKSYQGQFKTIAVLSILVVFVFFFVASKYEVSVHGLGYQSINSSEKVVDFLIDNHIKGPLFNDYDIGDYLAYRLYPNELVYIDGRPEAYPSDFIINEYIPLFLDNSKFGIVDSKYKFNALIFNYLNPDAESLITAVHQTNKWKLVYIDDSNVIFVKDADQNKSIIDQSKLTEDTYTIDPTDSFNNLSYKAKFFYLLENRKIMITLYKRMHELKPNDCSVLNNLIILLGKGNPESSMYKAQFINSCSSDF